MSASDASGMSHGHRGHDHKTLELEDHPSALLLEQAGVLWGRAEQARVIEPPSETYIDDQRVGFLENVARAEAWITVAHRRGRVLGCVAGFPGDDGSAGATQLLAYLVVDPSAWGRGIGRTLVERAEERSRQAGARRMKLTVHDGNARARRLYEGRGWRPTGRSERTPFDDQALIELEKVL